MTRAQAIRAAVARARAAGSFAVADDLRPFMTDEERATYDATPAARVHVRRFFGTWDDACRYFGRKPMRAGIGVMAFGGEAHWM